MNWNRDVNAAKPEGWVWVCVDNEKRWVGLSCWLPDEKRWNMLATTQEPYAWCPVTHPLSDVPYVKPQGMNVMDPPPIAARQTPPAEFTKVSLPMGMRI